MLSWRFGESIRMTESGYPKWLTYVDICWLCPIDAATHLIIKPAILSRLGSVLPTCQLPMAAMAMLKVTAALISMVSMVAGHGEAPSHAGCFVSNGTTMLAAAWKRRTGGVGPLEWGRERAWDENRCGAEAVNTMRAQQPSDVLPCFTYLLKK